MPYKSQDAVLNPLDIFEDRSIILDTKEIDRVFDKLCESVCLETCAAVLQ